MIVHSLMVYLCDKQKECKNRRSCGVFCNHTTDPDHAKNGMVHSPEETKGRFDEQHIALDNDEWLKIDKAMISVCDAIYLLCGWDESNGCEIERRYADELGLMIMEEGA